MAQPSFVLHTLCVGQLNANCYLVADPHTRQGLIIDPGDAADFIKTTLTDTKITPRLIIATHGHFDHLMAAADLALSYQIPVWIHQDDVFLATNLQSSARHFTQVDPGPPPPIGGHLIPGETIGIGTISFRILHTPGHTPGSVSLYEQQAGVVFSGDTLFAQGSVGRTDFSYSSRPHLETSLRTLLALPADTLVYPGHGQPTTIAHEQLFHV